MLRLRFVVPALGLALAPLLITACGGPRETVVSTTGGSTQPLSAQGLQQALDAYCDRLVSRTSAMGDRIDAAIHTPAIQRKTLGWRLRAAQVAFRAQHEPNALVALMQLWYWTAAINARAHSPELAKLLGEHVGLFTTTSDSLSQQAEALAARALPADAFKRVQADIAASTASGDLFSATSATDEAVLDQVLSATRLEKIIAIPLAPFDIFGGVNQGAEAITALSITANRAVDLAEVYPQVIEWRLRLVALDIQELDSVRSVVENLDTLTATAKTLPVQLREQVGILLEQSGPVQQETQKTLAGVRDAGTALQGAMTSTQGAITSLDQFIASLTPPPDPNATPVDPAHAPPPFRIEDYTTALNALTVATKEIHATLTDLQQPAFSGRVAEATSTAVDHAQRAADLTIDRLSWRIAQLIAFAAACGLVLIGAFPLAPPAVTYADQLLAVIAAPDAAAKDALLAAIAAPPDAATWVLPPVPERPGRPAGYREVADPPRRRRGLNHRHTRLRFLHAIHHIELSAIDLAVLLCLRAPGAPAALHRDFLAIAREEAEHSRLLGELLTHEGFAPGSDPVHHRLWDSARAADDLGEQLVVVPRFLEARGLDVSAELLPRLAAIDGTSHAVIMRIYTDEIRHVATGTRWHTWWCAAHGTTVEAHFAATVEKHFGPQLPGPFALDRPGRTTAGFSAAELALLEHPPWRAAPPSAAADAG